MLEPILCGLLSQAPLLPKLRGHFAEFLGNASSAGLGILSPSTCVGLRYGHDKDNRGFSRRAVLWASLLLVRSPSRFPSTRAGFSWPAGTPLGPGFPPPGPLCRTRPLSSALSWCRNLHLLSIGYGSRPRLRPRLTQGRSALPWKPWIFGRMDSHHALATHSGILPCMQSTCPYGHASPRIQCSPTALFKQHPGLRWRVSAPDIFGAEPLGQ